MHFEDAIQRAEAHWQARHGFVIYSMPHSDQFTLLLQQDSKVAHTASGVFVFAPFEKHAQAHALSLNQCELIQGSLPQNPIQGTPLDNQPASTPEKDRHIQLVEKAVETIRESDLSKVVVSRKASVPLTSWKLLEITKRLMGLYPTAFRYVWFHSQTGLWCGATPETLVAVEGGAFQTMALAGTKKDAAIPWTDKERSEQGIVTDEIVTKLRDHFDALQVSDPYDQQAGNLIHLRTDISSSIDGANRTVDQLAAILHPTPAVCGFPSALARQFLSQFEGYDRSFYTGYLGRVESLQQAGHLFVNLRCMRLETYQAEVFVGGGITEDSQAESEWLETQHKMQTMLQVLAPYLSD